MVKRSTAPGISGAQHRSSDAELSAAAHFAWHWRVAAGYRRRNGNVPIGGIRIPLTIPAERKFAATVTDLARVLSLPKATVSKHIGELLDAGLIEEAYDRTDRRRKYLRLTAQGLAERSAFLASSERALARVQRREAAHQARQDDFQSPNHVVRTLLKAAAGARGPQKTRAMRRQVPG
jgi:DNA-binding MarR family transcriptional regulator